MAIEMYTAARLSNTTVKHKLWPQIIFNARDDIRDNRRKYETN